MLFLISPTTRTHLCYPSLSYSSPSHIYSIMHLLSLFLPLILHPTYARASCRRVGDRSCQTFCDPSPICKIKAENKPACPAGQYLQETFLSNDGCAFQYNCRYTTYNNLKCFYRYECVRPLSLSGFFGLCLTRLKLISSSVRDDATCTRQLAYSGIQEFALGSLLGGA